MRKRLILLLSIIMILSGCGIKMEEDTINVCLYDEAEDEDVVYVDVLEDYASTEEEAYEEEEEETPTNPFWQRHKDTDFVKLNNRNFKSLESMWQFCINNTVITMPCSIGDLIDAGCYFDEDFYDDTLKPHADLTFFDLYYDDVYGKRINLVVAIDNRDYDEEASIYERSICWLDIMVDVFYFNYDTDFNFYVANGVSFGDMYYDAYDYYVIEPTDDDYTGGSLPTYDLSDDVGTVTYWAAINDTKLRRIGWVTKDNSKPIHYEIDKVHKYNIDNLPKWIQSDDISDDIFCDNKFSLNGVELKVPCSLDDILSTGYVPINHLSENTVLAAYETLWVDFYEEDEPTNMIKIMFANWDSEDVLVGEKDCVHVIHFLCKQPSEDSTTVMVKLSNGITSYTNYGTFSSVHDTGHLIEMESNIFQRVYRAANPPASISSDERYDVVEYVFDGIENNSKLMSIMIGGDMKPGVNYKY